MTTRGTDRRDAAWARELSVVMAVLGLAALVSLALHRI
jgi:hypothetical protein